MSRGTTGQNQSRNHHHHLESLIYATGPEYVPSDPETASDEEWTLAEYTSTSSDEEVTASFYDHRQRPNMCLPLFMHRKDPFRMPRPPTVIYRKKTEVLSLEEKKKRTLQAGSDEYRTWYRMRKEKKIQKRALRAKMERKAELARKKAEGSGTNKKRKINRKDSGEPKKIKVENPERHQPGRRCKSGEGETQGTPNQE